MNSILQFYIDAVEKIEKKIADNESLNNKQNRYVNELDKIKAFMLNYEHTLLDFFNTRSDLLQHYKV
jgi:predicted glycosyl hydrolase (DUF1957 family)